LQFSLAPWPSIAFTVLGTCLLKKRSPRILRNWSRCYKTLSCLQTTKM
jgi:hypothetical protein